MHWIDEKLKMLEPVLGSSKTAKLRMAYAFEDNKQDKYDIECYIDSLIAKLVKTTAQDMIILPPGQYQEGDIQLGKVGYIDKPMHDFEIQSKNLTRHMGIFGSTGSGKTTFAANLIDQLVKNDIPFLIIDWEKSYRFLAKKYPGVRVFTVGDKISPVHFNMLDVPPGVDTEEHIKSLINLMAIDYLSGAGSDTMLLKWMDMAFQEKRQPTFNDLKEIIVREIQKDMKGRGRLSGRSGLWKETVQRIALFLSYGGINKVFGSRYHFPPSDLLNGRIVLEMGGIASPRDRKFIIHYLLNWIFSYLRESGISHETLKHCIVMEEFHNIGIKSKDDNMISQMFRQMRKYGVGLVAIDQTPSEIENSVFANINIPVSFSLNTKPDIQAMAKVFGLDHITSKYLGMLRTGEAIAIQKQANYTPYIVNCPYINTTENITDEELKSICENSGISDSNVHIEIKQSSSQSIQGIDISPPNTIQPDPMEKILLQNIIERPFLGIKERLVLLGLHPEEMVKLTGDLERKGIIRSFTVDRKKLIEITKTGYDACKSAGIKFNKKDSKGGLEHNYWIHETAEKLRIHGIQTVQEFEQIDIVSLTEGIAIEVETGKSTIANNLLKLQQSHYNHRFMLSTNKPAEIKIKQIAAGFKGIKTMHVKDFLKLSKEQILDNQR